MSTNKKKDYEYNPPNMVPAIAKDDSHNINYGNYDFEPNTDYMQKRIEAEKAGDFNAASYYERMRNAKIASGFGGKYQPTYDLNYKSKYDDKISGLRNKLENYDSFSYDLESDDNYHALKNLYHQIALAAQKNALAQAAAANGGRLSSNAIIAASLGYGNKMSQLEGEIPQLRQAAYNMYLNDKADLRNLISDYESAEDKNYSRWANDYNRRYQKSRDLIADDRWNKQFEQSERSQNLSEALQKAMAFGYVTEDGAPVLGVNAGTPLYDTKNNDLATKLTLMQQLGYIPDEFAQQYGFSKGGNTLDRTQLNYNMQKNGVNPGGYSNTYSGSDVVEYEPSNIENNNNNKKQTQPLSNSAELWASDIAAQGINDRDGAIDFLLNNGASEEVIMEVLSYLKL